MSAVEKKGKALVTGASSGIGATYADRLAQRGHDLVLVARDEKRLSDLAAKLSAQYGVAVDVLKADLTPRDDVRGVEKRLREDAAIELLVNNAGIGPKGPLLADDLDYLEAMIDLNVVAVNRLAIAAAQTFAARGKGSIINIASVVALVPERFNGTYNATKAFVLNLTQSINAEAAGKGVKVQAVLPGVDPHRNLRSGRRLDRPARSVDGDGRHRSGRRGTCRFRPGRTDHHSIAARRCRLGSLHRGAPRAGAQSFA